MKNTKTLWEKYYLHSLTFCIFVFLVYTFGFYSSFFYSSILNYSGVSSDPFDGSVYPIEYIPNPIELSYEQRKQKFEEIDSKYFIKTPIYNPSIFWKDLETLSTWSQEYKNAITQKVLYTVPYLSTYNFDYKEYSWSHPGVDIVVPEWTPVRNIANGFIVDTGYQPSGFWYYVLVKHNDVSYSGKTQIFYSLYAHLSKITVTHGVKIAKGEQVWLVGESGTATVPHLHFQIDVSDAPYSPFWPFSSADMKQAWVWFFEAINIWLGKEAALMYTINPLKFVNDNLNTILYTNNNQEEPQPKPIEEEIKNLNPETTNSWTQEPVQTETQTNTWEEVPEENTNTWNQAVKKEDMLAYDVELLSAIDIDDIILNDNEAILSFENSSNTWEKIPQETTNTWENIDIEVPEVETPEENIPQAPTWIFSDIQEDYVYYKELEYFKVNNIISGFSDNSFRPKNNITRVEALKIILLANNIAPINDEASKFQDIQTNSWENTYVNAGIERWIISLDNKIFSPLRNVSRAEALKLILNVKGVNFDTLQKDLTFSDVSVEDWSYNYINYAIKNNLLEVQSSTFEPNKAITREELISVLYKSLEK